MVLASVITALTLPAASLASKLNADFDFTYATRMAHLSGAAYCSGDAVTAWACGYHCDNAKGLEMIQYIEDEKKVLAGYVAWDSTIKAILVSFRGTVGSIEDWVHNLAYTKTNPFAEHKHVGVHHGFWDSWQFLAPDVLAAIQTVQKSHRGKRVIITGHSLGAAIAADAALDLRLNHGFETSVLNFGSPRAGNSAFNALMQQLVPSFWRLTHHKDLVPHVPPEDFGFHHASTEVFFPGDDATYQICDGSGEDKTCSDKYLVDTSVSDHLTYFGIGMTCGESMLV